VSADASVWNGPDGGSAAGVEAILAASDPVVRERLADVERRLVEVAAQGAGPLAEHAQATVAAGGKRLRPLLVLVVGGDSAPAESAGRAALAVELIHSATLVHDDILDAASLRRGRPTVVAAAGRAVATATGDLLFACAFSELARNGRPEEVQALSDASAALAHGELLQREDAWCDDVSVERYLERCELKTATLFDAACHLGGLEAGSPPETLAGLRKFGRGVGLAFQLLDDVLDVAGPPERTGKARGTDLLDGTVTLPLILGRRRDPELARLALREVDGLAAAEEVCDRIVASGALHEVRERALQLAHDAQAAIPSDLPAGKRQALELVARGVVERHS
jgi:geranylgeranyl pyrophosphate synthase